MTTLARQQWGRHRDYALQICFALGVLVSLVLFRHPKEILRLAGWTVVQWTLLVIIVRLRWAAAGNPASLYTLVATIVYVFLVCNDRRLYLRYLIPVLLISSAIILGVLRAQVARRWRDAVLLITTSSLLVGLLWLAGPRLLGRIVPSCNLDLDHRPKPFNRALGTNEDGIVSPFAPSDFRPEDFNIIFLGDSFTQGIRAPYAFPAIVETLLTQRVPARRFRVANFGWTSSSPVLQVRQLRDIGAKYKPKLVVQCFDMTDFHDDLKYTHRFRERGIEPVQVSIFRVGWVVFSKALGVRDYSVWLESQMRWGAQKAWNDPDRARPRYFAAGQPLERTAPLLQTSWEAILATRAVAQNLGAQYVLVILPRYQQFNRKECPRDWEKDWPAWDDYIFEPFEYFRRQAATVPFPIHSLLEAFQTSGVFPVCFEDDPHWNVAGHQVAARAITEFLIRDGVLDRAGLPRSMARGSTSLEGDEALPADASIASR
jgi:hypothetical protein